MGLLGPINLLFCYIHAAHELFKKLYGNVSIVLNLSVEFSHGTLIHMHIIVLSKLDSL